MNLLLKEYSEFVKEAILLRILENTELSIVHFIIAEGHNSK